MKRIRILHTADLHLNSCFAKLGFDSGLGNHLRTAQLTVFERIISHAQRWPANALVIAGDLFDNTSVDADTLAYVADALEKLAPLPVFIAPGNRDPYTPDSPYALELWPDNITIFQPGAWHAFQHPSLPLTVHGIGFDGKDAPGPVFSDLEVPDDDQVHIAVAHGTERGHQPPEGKTFAPFDAADIACDRLAYLALGHFHGMTKVEGDFKTVIRYPGVPQGRNFQETGIKSFLQVEVAYEDIRVPAVTVKPVSVSEIVFEEACLDPSQLPESADFLNAPDAGEDRERILRLRLEGRRPLLSDGTVQEVLRMARSRFLHVEVVDDTVVDADTAPAPGENTCLARLVEAMRDRIRDEARPEAARHEAEALEMAVKACRGVEPSLPERVEACS